MTAHLLHLPIVLHLGGTPEEADAITKRIPAGLMPQKMSCVGYYNLIRIKLAEVRDTQTGDNK